MSSTIKLNANSEINGVLNSNLSRRALLRTGVLCYGFNWLSVQAADDKPQALPGSLRNNPKLDAWLNLHPDGTVTMLTGKVELGQGILTALTQIVADELDVSLSVIKVISGDTSLTPDEGVYPYKTVALRLDSPVQRCAPCSWTQPPKDLGPP